MFIFKMRIFINKIFPTVFFLFYFFVNSSNAEITLNIQKETAFISITGEIVDGDSEQFLKIISGVKNLVKNGFVILNSPGGIVTEAINIGGYLRANGFATAVLDKADCQSACALIWLAGNKRIATSTSRIGFHQSYTVNQSGNAVPSIQGNALVGYYLGKIDVSASVVSYVTTASPETFEWLSFAKAKELGIDVVALNDEEQTTMGRITKPEQPKITNNSNQQVARLPSKNDGNLPSYSNIQRSVKNVMTKYKKDGILGLHTSSIACWKRASELKSARSFQYCFSLDMISGYIDNAVSNNIASKRYKFFQSKNIINRQEAAQKYVLDRQNIPNDFVLQWGATAIDVTNQLVGAN